MLVASVFVASFVAAPAFSAGAQTDKTVLIINAENKAGLPRDYRSTAKHGKLSSAVGLEKLRSSASGQFSARQLDTILTQTGGSPLIALDLRQESHGFVDGTAVSWFAPRNNGNLGKTPAQIRQDETDLLAGLAQQQKVTVQKITDKSSDARIEGTEPVSLPARDVQSEEQLVTAKGATYLRVPNTDYVSFTDANIDQLVTFWQNRPPDSWLHLHCNAGAGRTTTALALFDMLENATVVKFRDILDRQEQLGGADLLSIRSKPQWRYDAQTERAEFIRRFYQYAREHPRGEGETWSSWAARNP